MQRLKNKKLLKITERLIASALLVVLIINLIVTAVPTSEAGTYSWFGSNLALGSPILNQNAVSNDWNPNETIVWGIFLSNFCIPFVDDYASAFSTNSTSGSQGRGLKSINFGSGSDVANSSTIKDLLTHAIKNQTTSLRPIYVAHSRWVNGEFQTSTAFDSTNVSETEAQSQPRHATLTDLFFEYYTDFEAGNIDTYNAFSTWSNFNGASNAENLLYSSDSAGGIASTTFSYNDIYGATAANIPTFAITDGASYRIVFDYKEAYDMQMFTGAIYEAVQSDYGKIAAEFIGKPDVMDSVPLYFDTYGNIVGGYNGRYIIIVPASANQYLTQENKLNLVNSIVFNAGTTSMGKENIIRTAGQGEFNTTFFGNLEVKVHSGGCAFNNDNYYTKNGGLVLFYDTDTILMQNIIENGNANTADGVGCIISGEGIGKAWVYDSNYRGDYTLSVDYGELMKELFDTEFNDQSNNVSFKIEPVYSYDSLTHWFDGLNNADEKLMVTTLNTSSSLANWMKSTGDKKRLTHLINVKNNEEIPLFKEEDSYIVAVQTGVGKSNNINTSWAAYRELPNFVYSVYNGSYSSLTTDEGGSSTAHNTSMLKGIVDDALKQNSSYSVANQLLLDNPDKPHSSSLGPLGEEFIYKFSNLGSTSGTNSALYKFKDTHTNPVNILSGISMDDGKPNKENGMDMLILRDCEHAGVDSLMNESDLSDRWSNKTEDLTGVELSNTLFSRLVKIYAVSDTLEAVSKVLGVRDGVELSQYAAYLYVTYLDWYGLETSNLTGEATSELNPNLFNESDKIQDVSDVTDVPSEEDMKAETLQYTYLMLHPDSGKEYRSEILMSNTESWIYKQYQNVVYGGSDTYNYSDISTRNATGFLYVENYSENFLTAWFMEDYPTYAVIIMAIGILLVLLFGLLSSRKISWFLINIILVVNIAIILPSTGEIVPYVANRVVQSVFDDKMTYWSISEQASGEAIQRESFTGMGLSEAEQRLASSLVNDSRALYLDRYLSYKQDISNKVTSAEKSAYDEIQSLRSARWLLPMVMSQYTASDGSADYVYVSLGDKLEDLSNLYWYYMPTNLGDADTFNSNDEEVTVSYDSYLADIGRGTYDIRDVSDRSQYNPGYIDTTNIMDGDMYYGAYDFKSRCYTGSSGYDEANNTHHYAYLLANDGNNSILYKFGATVYLANTGGVSHVVDARDEDYKSYDDWAEAYASQLVAKLGNVSDNDRLREVTEKLKNKNGQYDEFDRNTVDQSFGYLWYTESNLHYFYDMVKGTFEEGASLGSVAYDLQGYYSEDDADGLEHRNGFMFDSNNHATKDILDLEHLFYNVIPYLYTMQLYTGGYDGESGAFGTETISDGVYKGNLTSWLYRCNWVTKIMENPELHSPQTIHYYADGERKSYTVQNPLIPMYYYSANKDIDDVKNNTLDEGRPMVFSKAQQEYMGLLDSDLSTIELMCVELNEETSKDWTLLINYLGVSDMSAEIIMRQMALEATLNFNAKFSPSGVSNQSLNMFPSSLDLRSISFDSIMKMLMLNITKDTSYIYGDSMETIVRTSDFFTSLLLLVVAWFCCNLIPLIRNFTLALLFYLGFVATARTIFSDGRQKASVSMGYLGSHIIYLVMNIVYLMGFKLMMAMTVSDEVLTLNASSMRVGNPVWCLLVILLIDCLFCWGSLIMMRICIKNYKDMGMAVFKGAFDSVRMSITSGMDNLVGKLNEATATYDSDSKASSNRSIQTPVNQGGSSSDTTVESSGNSKRRRKRSDDTTQTTSGTGSNGSTGSDDQYYYNAAEPIHEDMDTASINDTIERGKKKTKKEKEEPDDIDDIQVEDDVEDTQ